MHLKRERDKSSTFTLPSCPHHSPSLLSSLSLSLLSAIFIPPLLSSLRLFSPLFNPPLFSLPLFSLSLCLLFSSPNLFSLQLLFPLVSSPFFISPLLFLFYPFYLLSVSLFLLFSTVFFLSLLPCPKLFISLLLSSSLLHSL